MKSKYAAISVLCSPHLLNICFLQSYFFAVSGLHLEPPDEGDRAEAAGPHRRRPVHGLPPHREHHRVGVARERQDHQAVEERHVIGSRAPEYFSPASAPP